MPAAAAAAEAKPRAPHSHCLCSTSRIQYNIKDADHSLALRLSTWTTVICRELVVWLWSKGPHTNKLTQCPTDTV